jgi:hypothetical protein
MTDEQRTQAGQDLLTTLDAVSIATNALIDITQSLLRENARLRTIVLCVSPQSLREVDAPLTITPFESTYRPEDGAQ